MRIFYIPFCLPMPGIELLEDGTFKPKKPEIEIGQPSNKTERHKVELNEGNSLENYLKYLVPKIRAGAFRYGKSKGDSFEIRIVLTETQYVETLKMYGATEEEAKKIATELAGEARLKIQQVIDKITAELKLKNSISQNAENNSIADNNNNTIENITVINWKESYDENKYEKILKDSFSNEEYQKPIETKKIKAKSLKDAYEKDIRDRLNQFKHQLARMGCKLNKAQEAVAQAALAKFLQIEAVATTCWSENDSISCNFYPNNLSNIMYALLSKFNTDSTIDAFHIKCRGGLVEAKKTTTEIPLSSSPGSSGSDSSQTYETSTSLSDSENSPKVRRRKILKDNSDSSNESLLEEKVTNQVTHIVNKLVENGYSGFSVKYELPEGGKIEVQVDGQSSPSKKKPYRKNEQKYFERKETNYSDAKLLTQQRDLRRQKIARKLDLSKNSERFEVDKLASDNIQISKDSDGAVIGFKSKKNKRSCLIM